MAEYWREFAQARKGSITVKMLLNHQAGLPALRGTLSRGAFYDWDFMVATLEKEEPFWQPGTRTGYHGFTFGWLVGEVVRRVSGKSLGTFFQEEVARPLGIDFWIGLPRHLESRVARMIPGALDTTTRFFAALQDPSSLPSLMFLNTGGYMAEPDYDSPVAHTAEIGGSGGITNARGLACLYAPLATRGKGLATRDAIARMAAVSSATGRDAVLLMPTRFSLGFMKSMDNRRLAAARTTASFCLRRHSGMPDSVARSDLPTRKQRCRSGTP